MKRYVFAAVIAVDAETPEKAAELADKLSRMTNYGYVTRDKSKAGKVTETSKYPQSFN